jgi:hypothetical protein
MTKKLETLSECPCGAKAYHFTGQCVVGDPGQRGIGRVVPDLDLETLPQVTCENCGRQFNVSNPDQFVVDFSGPTLISYVFVEQIPDFLILNGNTGDFGFLHLQLAMTDKPPFWHCIMSPQQFKKAFGIDAPDYPRLPVTRK